MLSSLPPSSQTSNYKKSLKSLERKNAAKKIQKRIRLSRHFRLTVTIWGSTLTPYPMTRAINLLKFHHQLRQILQRTLTESWRWLHNWKTFPSANKCFCAVFVNKASVNSLHLHHRMNWTNIWSTCIGNPVLCVILVKTWLIETH